jgi:hypothetical protein
METECVSQWKADAIIDLTITVKYEGVANEDNARPLIFHNETFRTGKKLREGIRLYRFHPKQQKWERYNPDNGFGTGFGIFDDPPFPVDIGDENSKYSDRFTSLQPGDTWTTQRRVQNGTSWTSLPDDVEAGGRFKYVIKGAVVDWWDWGRRRSTGVWWSSCRVGFLEMLLNRGRMGEDRGLSCLLLMRWSFSI